MPVRSISRVNLAFPLGELSLKVTDTESIKIFKKDFNCLKGMEFSMRGYCGLVYPLRPRCARPPLP